MSNSSPTYSKSGVKSSTSTKLNQDIFGITQINNQLLQQAYDAYNANGRINLSVSKTRGLVSGGGKKPWRQKGTGRARVGSSRTPLWRGGGIIFGPTGNENYSKKLNLQSKRLALRQALSSANAAGKIKIIDEFSLKNCKTKELAGLLNKIGAEGYTLIVSDNIVDNLKKASNNLAQTKVIQAKYLNVPRLMDSDCVVISKAALTEIETWLKVRPMKVKASN